MYLHLGADISIIAEDVIAIFDYDLIEAPSVKEMIELGEWNKAVNKLKGTPKSIVLTLDKLYLVPLSRTTLARRWDRHTKPFFPSI